MVQEDESALPGWRRLAAIAFSQKRYADAHQALAHVLGRLPRDPAARRLQSQLMRAEGRAAEVIEPLSQLISDRPSDALLRLELAQALAATGQIEDSRAQLRKASKLEPGWIEPKLLLARSYFEEDRPARAVAQLEELLADSKHAANPELFRLLGTTYLADQRIWEALRAWRRFHNLRPELAVGPHLMGLAYRALDKGEEARQAFEKALELQADFEAPLAQLVEMELQSDQTERALERVLAQLLLFPDSPGFNYLLGNVHRARQELKAAQTAFQKAIALRPDLVEAHLQLAATELQMGDLDSAHASIEKGLSQLPNNLQLRMLRGNIQHQRGQLAEALSDYQAVLQENPDSVMAKNNMAYVLLESGELERAERLAREAHQQAPEDPRVQDTLGWILHQAGNHRAAHTLLRRSAAKLPDNAEVQFHLGMTLFALKDTEAAAKLLTRSLALMRKDNLAVEPPFAALARATLSTIQSDEKTYP